MRRDYFTLEFDDLDGDGKPTIHVHFDGPADSLEERLATVSDDIDLAFRYRTDADETDASGVLSVTDRVTGDFVLEVNADAEQVRTLVDSARQNSQSGESGGCYRIRVSHDDETDLVSDKRTLLVYDQDGSLMRQHSLIPSGVEL